jgi:hypothetical protein
MRIVPARAREVRLVQGIGGARPQGWYAPSPGERHPAPVLSLVAGGRAPFVFGYALLPRAGAGAELALQHDAFRLQASLLTGTIEYVLTVVQGEVEMRTRAG